ncbi:MAG: thiamine pyrophosphate-binding protein [Deltaproteobacteria bacterium]|nr:thiamine pyrophosphate-binding protein [Deltaproteobacteria bacterium]
MTKKKKVERGEILVHLGKSLSENDILVAAFAGTTYECYTNLHRPGNLYAVGMGMVTPVAFGLAQALPRRRIIALDTDGGTLLSPSILAVVGLYRPKNLSILVFDNERLYGSRQGPPSPTAFHTDLAGMARAAGIEKAATVEDLNGFNARLSWFLSEAGPALLVAKVEPTFIRGDGPSLNGQENKFRLVRLIEETENVKILEGAR